MKLCFSSYVYGWYQDFVPLYLYSISQSYPQHYAKIYYRDYLTINNRKSLEELRKSWDHFDIVEEYRGVDTSHIKHLPAVRYLIPQREFHDYDYLYMGDVDFLILPEYDCNFYSYYLEHCRHTGLPFSNSISWDREHPRLTGLHFVIVKPYFQAIQNIVNSVVRGEHLFCNSIMDNVTTFDEQMLYAIVEEAFDLQPLLEYRRPHHGIHFGDLRTRPLGHSLCNKHRLVLWQQHSSHLKSLFANPLFSIIYNNLGSETRNIVDRLFYVLRYPRSFL